MSTARAHYLQTSLYFRKTISFDTPGIATGVVIGVIPAGSMVRFAEVIVKTGYNGSGTVTMTAGSTGTGTDVLLAADANVKTTGVKTGTTKKYFSAETTLYAAIVDQNTNSTAGEADIVVEYVQDNDQ